MSIAEPAEPPPLDTSKEYFPGRGLPGANATSVDPIAAPFTSARVISAAAKRAVRCWGLRPGFGLFIRIPEIANGTPSQAEREREVRSICPRPHRNCPKYLT